MDTDNVLTIAMIPSCAECRRLWLPGDSERWRAEFIDDGPAEILLFWCPGCWQREFAQSR